MNKEKAKRYGGYAKEIGKSILFEGTKAVLLSAIGIAASTFFAEGKAGLKKLTLENYLGKDTEDTN